MSSDRVFAPQGLPVRTTDNQLVFAESLYTEVQADRDADIVYRACESGFSGWGTEPVKVILDLLHDKSREQINLLSARYALHYGRRMDSVLLDKEFTGEDWRALAASLHGDGSRKKAAVVGHPDTSDNTDQLAGRITDLRKKADRWQSSFVTWVEKNARFDDSFESDQERLIRHLDAAEDDLKSDRVASAASHVKFAETDATIQSSNKEAAFSAVGSTLSTAVAIALAIGSRGKAKVSPAAVSAAASAATGAVARIATNAATGAVVDAAKHAAARAGVSLGALLTRGFGGSATSAGVYALNDEARPRDVLKEGGIGFVNGFGLGPVSVSGLKAIQAGGWKLVHQLAKQALATGGATGAIQTGAKESTWGRGAGDGVQKVAVGAATSAIVTVPLALAGEGVAFGSKALGQVLTQAVDSAFPARVTPPAELAGKLVQNYFPPTEKGVYIGAGGAVDVVTVFALQGRGSVGFKLKPSGGVEFDALADITFETPFTHTVPWGSKKGHLEAFEPNTSDNPIAHAANATGAALVNWQVAQVKKLPPKIASHMSVGGSGVPYYEINWSPLTGWNRTLESPGIGGISRANGSMTIAVSYSNSTIWALNQLFDLNLAPAVGDGHLPLSLIGDLTVMHPLLADARVPARKLKEMFAPQLIEAGWSPFGVSAEQMPEVADKLVDRLIVLQRAEEIRTVAREGAAGQIKALESAGYFGGASPKDIEEATLNLAQHIEKQVIETPNQPLTMKDDDEIIDVRPKLVSAVKQFLDELGEPATASEPSFSPPSLLGSGLVVPVRNNATERPWALIGGAD